MVALLTFTLLSAGARSAFPKKAHAMLQDFLTTHRDAIIARSRDKLTARPWPVKARIVEHGVPLFLTQLSETLGREETASPSSLTSLRATAVLHGRELLALGFTVSQVVHDYGDICQAVTELAMEQNAPITTAEFHTLNRCLDTAIASAVSEHARLTTETHSLEDAERSGLMAHDARDLVNGALLAFQALERGALGVNGSTGAALARSLTSLRHLLDSTLTDVRLTAQRDRREFTALAPFLTELAVTSALQAEACDVHFTLETVDQTLAVMADRQMLTSAAMNLLSNAFKFTPVSGHVVLRADRRDLQAVIEIEDECGGIPHTDSDPFKSFADQRGVNRSGLGLGLFIARKAVRAHGGDIYIRNMAGKGCAFSIEMPLAGQAASISV